MFGICRHNYVELTGKPRTIYCKKCGKKKTFPCEHNYVQSTQDVNTVYCTNCGDIKIIPCNHTWKITESFTRKNPYKYSIDGKTYMKVCPKCNEHKMEKVWL